MKYAFLTTLIPDQMDNEVRRCSTNNMQDAANALQWHIYEGLTVTLPVKPTIFNILPIGSFPQYYSKPFIFDSYFSTADDGKHINIGFCNIKLIRRWRQSKRVFSKLKKWCAADDEDKTIIVYTVSASFVSAISKLKAIFPNTNICAIVADLPDMSSLSSKKNWIQRFFEKSQAKESYTKLSCIDCFVLLTKQMADYMKIHQPYVVMEGISTDSKIQKVENDDGIKRILYSGTLHKRFGILNLVEAFKTINDKNYRLIICGTGDSEEEIRACSAIDNRIEFKGQLKREEILKLQQTVSVLVNPRQNNEEFTKYSFPSKNLEYLSSGVPLVAYKLDGIPDEYDDYINYVNGNSIEDLKRTLIETCTDIDGAARNRAKLAEVFVKTEKNSYAQALKIKKLLEHIH